MIFFPFLCAWFSLIRGTMFLIPEIDKLHRFTSAIGGVLHIPVKKAARSF